MRSVGVYMDWSKGPFHLIDAAPPIEVISKNSPPQDKEDQSADT